MYACICLHIGAQAAWAILYPAQAANATMRQVSEPRPLMDTDL